MIQFEKKSAHHIVTAYNLMISSMQKAFDGSEYEQPPMTLQRALDSARHEVVHQGIITAEEGHEIAEFIKHDVNDAAEIMMESSTEFHDWLSLDIDTIERKVMQKFLNIADLTADIMGGLCDMPANLSNGNTGITKKLPAQMSMPSLLTDQHSHKKQ